MAATLNPQLMAYLAQMLGPRLTPAHIEGALLMKGMEEYSKSLTPKQPSRPPQPQAGGQSVINRQVPGPGPLRSGTQPMQIEMLASLLANPEIAKQLANLPAMPANVRRPEPGIPGAPPGPIPA